MSLNVTSNLSYSLVGLSMTFLALSPPFLRHSSMSCVFFNSPLAGIIQLSNPLLRLRDPLVPAFAPLHQSLFIPFGLATLALSLLSNTFRSSVSLCGHLTSGLITSLLFQSSGRFGCQRVSVLRSETRSMIKLHSFSAEGEHWRYWFRDWISLWIFHS